MTVPSAKSCMVCPSSTFAISSRTRRAKGRIAQDSMSTHPSQHTGLRSRAHVVGANAPSSVRTTEAREIASGARASR